MPKEEPTTNDINNQHENSKGGYYKKLHYWVYCKKYNQPAIKPNQQRTNKPNKEEATESRGPAI
jgi:hypothetical protein